MTSTFNKEDILEIEESFYDTSDIVKGDVLRKYAIKDKVSYPCLVLECDKLEQFRIASMQGVLQSSKKESDEDMEFHVYIAIKNAMAKVGKLPSSVLGVILKNELYNVFEKSIHLDEETSIQGDLIMAFCRTTSRD